jgi:hypothetical protein
VRTLEIRGEMGNRVAIAVRGYERPEPQETDADANWLQCGIVAEVGGFRGEVEAALITHDFKAFAAEVEALVTRLSSVATFVTVEESLTLRIQMDVAGRAVVSGLLQGSDIPRSVLSFCFDSDNSFIAELPAQLALILEEFPIRVG